MGKRFTSLLMVISFLGGILVLPFPATANETGKKHTTIGLGAASAALLLTQRNKTTGILTGAGAVYSYSQYQREHNHNQRARAYRNGYRSGYRSAHSRR